MNRSDIPKSTLEFCSRSLMSLSRGPGTTKLPGDQTAERMAPSDAPSPAASLPLWGVDRKTMPLQRLSIALSSRSKATLIVCAAINDGLLSKYTSLTDLLNNNSSEAVTHKNDWVCFHLELESVWKIHIEIIHLQRFAVDSVGLAANQAQNPDTPLCLG